MGESLASNLARAAAWLLAAGVVAVLWVGGFADLGAYRGRAEDPRYAVEHGAALLTAVLAVIAAFQIDGAPGRLWVWLPAPALLAWVAAAGTGCLETWLQGVHGDWIEGAECFGFLLAVSSLLALSLLVPLYRAQPRARPRAAAMAGLGVAAFAAALLQFFHPFAGTPLDVAAHAAAMALVIGVAAWSPRLVPSI